MLRLHHLTAGARFIAHRFDELHPFEVQAMLLYACNLKCSYCRCPEIKSELLTTAQWKELIRGLAALGTMRLKFQGGEPTLRQDFKELCAASRAAGIRTAVITNGTRLAEEPHLLDELDEVVVSLDSPTPEHHDRWRGKGTHALAVRALELAAVRGRPTFVVMVVNRHSYDQMEAMLEFCEARRIRLHCQPVIFGRAPFDDGAKGLALSDEQMRAMHLKLAEWKRAGRALMFAAAVYRNVADWPDHGVLTRNSEGESDCVAGHFYVHIEPNGDVWPCHQHGAHFTAKNCVRDGLEAALRNAQHHDCGDCFSVYLNERKAVFGLRPAALLEVVRRG